MNLCCSKTGGDCNVGSRITTDHDEIKSRLEARGGRPVKVKGTRGGRDAGLLRIDFPGFGEDDRFEEISWEEFFDKFEKNKLGFLHQDETSSGELSRFNNFVGRGGKGGRGRPKRH